MLNNKGQSLILFIVILPILLLILVLVIDVGRIIVLKQELDNINKIVLDYGLDNLDMDDLNNKMVELVKLNNNEIDDININLEEDKLYIELNMDTGGMLSGLVDISIFDIKSSYVGYIKDDKKIIERISGWYYESFFGKSSYGFFS